ncbi:uncharacterized protein [Clytia hemisphaerica]|uniref:uncharacterized protein n=1 Tax=Clytia hemisphaerica TaxID=252671 RepID=UPI0034D55CB4
MFYICHACQPNTIPRGSDGDNKRKKKKVTKDAAPSIPSQDRPTELLESDTEDVVLLSTQDAEDKEINTRETQNQNQQDDFGSSNRTCRFYKNGNCKDCPSDEGRNHGDTGQKDHLYRESSSSPSADANLSNTPVSYANCTDDQANSSPSKLQSNSVPIINNFAFFNVQGLCPQTVPSKVPFIENNICHKSLLFVGLSETWLNNHKDAELKVEGYTLFKCDSSRKKKSRGRATGGVCFYIRDDIAASCEIIYSHKSPSVQLLCVYSKTENLAMLVIYRQPDDKSNGNPSTAKDLLTPLKGAKQALSALEPVPNIIFGGDFNLPKSTWPDGLPKTGCSMEERSMLNDLNRFCNELFMSQYVNQPTHKDGNTLDLVFTNNEDLIHDYSILPVLQSTSHHSIVMVSTRLKVQSFSSNDDKPEPRSKFNALNFFSDEIDWNKLKEDLNQIDWDVKLNSDDPQEILEKKNSKYFFAYARKKAKIKTKIGPLLNTNGELTQQSKEMADEILSRQYVSVFSAPKPFDIIQSENDEVNVDIISDLQVTEDDLIKAINDLSQTAAPGPDGFPATFLKQCKEELSIPLCILWRQSLDKGIVPDELKRCTITPIHKGGSRSLASNYRPVALTSHVIKIFEKVLRAHIVKHMDEKIICSIPINMDSEAGVHVISGVPQGSVLGPLIFLILIGDIDKEVVHSFLKSFADDTRATKEVKTLEDAVLLQKDLDRIYKWTDDNNMKLNDIKFELLRYGKNHEIKTQTSYTSPSGVEIENKDVVKDLGILMDSNCTFQKQITAVIEKAKKLNILDPENFFLHDL